MLSRLIKFAVAMATATLLVASSAVAQYPSPTYNNLTVLGTCTGCGSIPSGVTAPFFNGTGPNPFRVSGTTIVDASRNGTFASVAAAVLNATGNSGFQLGGTSILQPGAALSPSTTAIFGGNLVPTGTNGNGTIWDFDSSYSVTTGDNRPYFLHSGITWGGSSPNSSINEEFFSSANYTWNGPMQVTQEQNSIHGYMENDVGTGCSPISQCTQAGFQEVFEASGINNIAASTWSSYLGIFTNATGATLGNYWGFKCGLTNNGTISRSACLEMDALSGTAPTTYYSILLNDVNAGFNSLGPVGIGTVTIFNNRSLVVKGVDSSGSTVAEEFQNSAGAFTVRFTNAGDETMNGALNVGNTIVSTNGIRNTSIGLTNPSTASVTTLAANSTVTFSNLSTVGTIAGSICATTGGLILYESGAASCIISLESIKHDIKPLAVETARHDLMALEPRQFVMNEPANGPVRYGFTAHQVNGVNPLLSTFDGKGDLQAYDPNAILAETVAVVKEQQAEIEGKATIPTSEADQISLQQTEIYFLAAWCLFLSSWLAIVTIRRQGDQ